MKLLFISSLAVAGTTLRVWYVDDNVHKGYNKMTSLAVRYHQHFKIKQYQQFQTT